MSIEYSIEIASWMIALALLYFYVPKKKYREAQLSFLFMQGLTWILGLLAVELRLLEYPVRFFSYTTRVSFTFEYFVFPVVSVIFNLYFPKEGTGLRKILYSLAFPTIITIAEVILEEYTACIEYINWHWSWSWISMLVTLLLSYGYYKWFFSKYRTIQHG